MSIDLPCDRCPNSDTCRVPCGDYIKYFKAKPKGTRWILGTKRKREPKPKPITHEIRSKWICPLCGFEEWLTRGENLHNNGGKSCPRCNMGMEQRYRSKPNAPKDPKP